MFLTINRFTLKCKNCDIFLTDELYCIKCKHRISGDIRENLLKFYNRFKITSFEDKLFHICPSHEALIRYDDGCIACEEKIPETLGILINLEKDLIPQYRNAGTRFVVAFNKHLTRDFTFKGNMIVESEEVIDSEEEF